MLDSGIMGAMKITILTLIVLLLTAPAQAAFLGGNPRLGESFLERRSEQVAKGKGQKENGKRKKGQKGDILVFLEK